MKNKKTLLMLVFALALILVAGLAGGGGVVVQQRQAVTVAAQTKDGAKPATEAKADSHTYKYVTLDKVIVMLRGTAGQPVTHYMAVDLVFKTRAEQEKTVKEHLPLLRSVAVRALSAYTMDKAGLMSIDQFAADINKAFSESYQRDQRDKPFAEAMIGKLIIE